MVLKLLREIKIIFLILMVVGYVLSTWYKKELQKQKERQINKRPITSKSAEDIFKELQKALSDAKSGGSPQVRPIEQPVNSTSPSPKKPYVKQSMANTRETMKSDVFTKYKSITKRKPLKVSKFKTSNKTFEEIKEEEIADQEIYRPDFDVRKAIIYSEILKRSQY